MATSAAARGTAQRRLPSDAFNSALTATNRPPRRLLDHAEFQEAVPDRQSRPRTALPQRGSHEGAAAPASGHSASYPNVKHPGDAQHGESNALYSGGATNRLESVPEESVEPQSPVAGPKGTHSHPSSGYAEAPIASPSRMAAPEYFRPSFYSLTQLFYKTYRFCPNISKTKQSKIKEKFIRLSAHSPELIKTMEGATARFKHRLPIEFSLMPGGSIDSASGKINLHINLPINQQVSLLIFETANAKNLDNINSQYHTNYSNPEDLDCIDRNKSKFDRITQQTIVGGIKKDSKNLNELAHQRALMPDMLHEIEIKAQAALRKELQAGLASGGPVESLARNRKFSFVIEKKKLEEKILLNPKYALQISQEIYGEQHLRLSSCVAIRVENAEMQSARDHIKILEEAQINISFSQPGSYKKGVFDLKTLRDMDFYGQVINEHLKNGCSLSDSLLNLLMLQVNEGHTYGYLKSALHGYKPYLQSSLVEQIAAHPDDTIPNI